MLSSNGESKRKGSKNRVASGQVNSTQVATGLVARESGQRLEGQGTPSALWQESQESEPFVLRTYILVGWG